MARLILIRHGESVANSEGRFTRFDDEPLTENGVSQAQRTAQRLSSLFQPVRVYSSPFLRALETARLIAAAFELEPVVERELYEQNFGKLKGAPYEHYYVERSAVADGWWSRRPPGGESLTEVAGRVGPVIDRLARLHQGEQVVVVSHGGVMAALRAHIAGRFIGTPESTENAGGYLITGRPAAYVGPLPLFDEKPLDALS